MKLEIFGYVTIRECGCVCQFASPEAIDGHVVTDEFREAMADNCTFRAVGEEEFRSLPWRCHECRPPTTVETKL